MVTKPGQQPSPSRSFILAVDVGTTKIKVCVFEGAKCSLVYGAEESLSLISIDDELVEVDPENLWEQLQQMIKTALANTQSKGTVVAMGLSCQRNTFISWDKRTLKPFHRLITWKDNRARQFCDQWNHSITKRLLNVAGWVAYLFTRSQRFNAARMFRMLGAMVPPRFLVTLKQNPNMRAQLAAGNLALGTMDTWLLLRLSGRQLAFLSEPSSASSTGMFDPFTGTWGQQILRLFGFPHSVLPPLVDTTKIRVHTDETLFGHPILITAMLGDSQAAAFGAGCIRKGDLKISLGTGTLFDFVCGADVHASMCGIYPLVGWKINGESTHLLEGRANETASVFQWAHAVGLLDSLEPSHLEAASERAQRANPGQGQLCFVPAFSGIQTPLDDDYACAAFLGIRSSTTRDQVLRALFESIAFGVYQIWECMMQKVPVARESVCRIRCCGGISQNDFICQQMATLIGRPLERVKEPQFCSAKGAALLAGIANGLWTVAETEELVDVERCFQPVREERSELLARFRRWQQVHWRCLNYYSPHQRQQQG